MFTYKYIRNIIWKTANRLARKTNSYWVIKTREGLKQFQFTALLSPEVFDGVEISIPACQLYMGPDFLKDNYTLLGRNIKDTPHYGLMKAIRESCLIKSTEYFERFVNAKIDWRMFQSPICNEELYISKFKKSLEEIERDEYVPIMIYKVHDLYYIYDGKHRAALCALLNKNIKCKLYPSEIARIGGFKCLFLHMTGDSSFSKHIEFLTKMQDNNGKR